METSSLSKGKADLLDFFANPYGLQNLLCNPPHLTYEAVQNRLGLFRNIASSFVLKSAETSMAPQVCLFIKKRP